MPRDKIHDLSEEKKSRLFCLASQRLPKVAAKVCVLEVSQTESVKTRKRKKHKTKKLYRVLIPNSGLLSWNSVNETEKEASMKLRAIPARHS